MLPECLLCRKANQGIKNIRGDLDLEGCMLAEHPALLRIPENESLTLCQNCIDLERNQGRAMNVPESQASHPLSQGIVLASESLSSVNQTQYAIESETIYSANDSIDLDRLNDSEEIRKLCKNNPVAHRNIKNIMSKQMPATVKKRKIQEVLNNDCGNVPSIPNSEPAQETIQSNNRSLLQRLLDKASVSEIRRYKHSNSLSRSSSLETVNARSISTSSSSQNISAPSVLVRPSPMITARRQNPPSFQPPSPIQPANPAGPSPAFYESDSSSSNGSVRSTRRSNASTRQSASRIDDGNAHSNSAAPRRINIPTHHVHGVKNIGG